MVEGGYTLSSFKRVAVLVAWDGKLWFELTGRFPVPGNWESERLALQCWLWETYERQRQQHAACVSIGEIAIPIWRRVPEPPPHERPGEELNLRGWVRGSNLAEEKTLRHLSRPEGLAAQLQAEYEHDGLGNCWPAIEAIFKLGKALGRSLQSTRDGRVRILVIDGKSKQCLTAWPASRVRAIAVMGLRKSCRNFRFTWRVSDAVRKPYRKQLCFSWHPALLPGNVRPLALCLRAPGNQ